MDLRFVLKAIAHLSLAEEGARGVKEKE